MFTYSSPLFTCITGDKFRFAIDRGGTFTDVWYSLPSRGGGGNEGRRGGGLGINEGGRINPGGIKGEGGKVVVERENRSGVTKLLSYDPANYADAPTEAIRRIMNKVSHVFVVFMYL